MQLKTTHLKPIKFIAVVLFTIGSMSISAQEVVVVDSTGVAQQSNDVVIPTIKTDTVKVPFKRFKAEGVTAVVGDYVVLDSDIDKSYIELQQQGIAVEGISRCQLLGKLLEDKLYAHHAKQDSIVVSEAEITSQVDQQVQYMISELGSEDKVAKYYRKDNIGELKTELYAVNRTLKLASEMQRAVIEKVEVTPEETSQFFYSIPEEDRPVFSAEVEVAQIIIEPEVNEEARQGVIDRLNSIRADIVDSGSSFSTKAVLYSKDGTAQKGGLIEGIQRTSPLAKEFKDQAFSLLEGEVSVPFETEFGFHILMVDKIRGQEVDVRHIILFPELSQDVIDAAKTEIEELREKIINGEITFDEAAKKFSDQKETKNNGGQLVNPVTGDTRFDLTKMDPTLSAQVYNLTNGEVSKVYNDRDYTGKSKYKILTVTNKYDEHQANYSKDYEKIKALALKEKQIRMIEEWQDKKIKETYINVNEDYLDCDFSSNWIKK
jgi:peptidyl-prolyl cis-trans isomerase SurA